MRTKVSIMYLGTFRKKFFFEKGEKIFFLYTFFSRQSGQGTSAQAESLAKNVEVRLNELLATVNQAINRVEKSGIQQPAPTVVGRLEQARRWLEQPGKYNN